MASGRTHAAATLFAACAMVPLLPAAISHFGPEVVAAIPGCVAGLIVGPDADVDGGWLAFWQVRRAWGPAGGAAAFAYRALWYPYAKLIPHRHWLSHMPVVGTAGRLVYLAWLPALVLVVAGHASAVADLLQSPVLWWACAGLAVSDGLHWAFDVISIKRLFGKRSVFGGAENRRRNTPKWRQNGTLRRLQAK